MICRRESTLNLLRGQFLISLLIVMKLHIIMKCEMKLKKSCHTYKTWKKYKYSPSDKNLSIAWA